MDVTPGFRASLTFFVIDTDDHGEGGAEWYDAIDRTGPGSLALLNLHPAVNVVTWNSFDFG